MAQAIKHLSAMQETQIWSLGREIHWRRERLHTPVFLPGELYGERSLAGYSPWSHIESDMTENTGQAQMMTRFRIFNTGVKKMREETWICTCKALSRGLSVAGTDWFCRKAKVKTSSVAQSWGAESSVWEHGGNLKSSEQGSMRKRPTAIMKRKLESQQMGRSFLFN